MVAEIAAEAERSDFAPLDVSRRELAPRGVPERNVTPAGRAEGGVERARRDLQSRDGMENVTVENVQRSLDLAPLPVPNDDR